MMKKFISILSLCLIFACGSSKINQSTIIGEYEKVLKSKGKLSATYNLVLKKENRFILSIISQDSNSSCNGNWELRDENKIYLSCDTTEDTGEVLSSGYMKERSHNVKFINNNKLNYRGIILKRKKLI